MINIRVYLTGVRLPHWLAANWVATYELAFQRQATSTPGYSVKKKLLAEILSDRLRENDPNKIIMGQLRRGLTAFGSPCVICGKDEEIIMDHVRSILKIFGAA